MSKRSDKFWAYLESSGALDQGPEAIEKAKIEYRRIYHREYRAQRRQKLAEHVVSFEPAEESLIKEAAKGCNLTVADFIKTASLSYLNNSFVPLNLTATRKIEACLIRSLSALERISKEQNNKGWFGRSNDYENVKAIVRELRIEVQRELYNPDRLITAVMNAPGQWPEILKAITNDTKDHWNKK